MTTNSIEFLQELEGVIRARRTASSDSSYTKKLFSRGTPYIAQKVGEEGVEVAIAAVQGDNARLVSETADLCYHMMVLLEDAGLSLGDVAAELAARHRN